MKYLDQNNVEGGQDKLQNITKTGMVDESLRRPFASRGVGGGDKQHVNIIPSRLYIFRRVAPRWWSASSTSDIFRESVSITSVARKRIINVSVAKRT